MKLNDLVNWKLVVTCASILALSACFHDEDDDDESLIGSWQGPCETGDEVDAGVGSEHQVVTFDSGGTGSIAGAEYDSTDCSGTAIDEYNDTLTYTINDGVLELVGSFLDGGSENVSYSISGSTLRLGDDSWTLTTSPVPVASDATPPDTSVVGSWLDDSCTLNDDNNYENIVVTFYSGGSGFISGEEYEVAGCAGIASQYSDALTYTTVNGVLTLNGSDWVETLSYTASGSTVTVTDTIDNEVTILESTDSLTPTPVPSAIVGSWQRPCEVETENNFGSSQAELTFNTDGTGKNTGQEYEDDFCVTPLVDGSWDNDLHFIAADGTLTLNVDDDDGPFQVNYSISGNELETSDGDETTIWTKQ